MSAEAALSEKLPYLGDAWESLVFFGRFASAALPEHQALPSSSNHPSVSSGVTDMHHLVAATSLPFSTENSEEPLKSRTGVISEPQDCRETG